MFHPYLNILVGALGISAGIHLVATACYRLGYDNGLSDFVAQVHEVTKPEILPEVVDSKVDVKIVKEGKKEEEEQ